MQATRDSKFERSAGVADTAAPSRPHASSEPPVRRFHAQPGVSAARAAGATVLLDVRGGLYHTLNQAAGRIWDTIEAGDATFDDLVGVLGAEHADVPRETIARDVAQLLDTLLEAGLVIAAEQSRATGGGGITGGAP